MSGCTVRVVTEDDISAIAHMEALCFSEPWSEAALLETLRGENVYLFCAECMGAVVSYAGLYVAPPMDGFAGEGSITNIATLPEFRGRGYAGAVLSALLDAAASVGAEDIFLEVRVSNTPAIRLYEKYGFETVGTRKNFYRQPREDALVMRYRKRL